MKISWFLSPRLSFVIEIVVVMVFLGALYWNLSTYAKIRNLREEIKKLEQTLTRLDRLERKVKRYNRVKASLLSSMSAQKLNYHWEDVSLEFGPIEFSDLLSRLELLNTEIQQKYHKRGIFVLTQFNTIHPDSKATDQSNDTTGAFKAKGRPGFEIRGRLLCLCQ